MSVKINLLERSPGHWRLKISEAGQKDTYVSLTGTRDDAERKRVEIIKAKEDGSWADPSKLTLNAYLDTYLQTRLAMGAIRRSTAELYEQWLTRYLRPKLGGKRLQQITGHDIQAVYNEMRSPTRAYQGGRAKSGALSASTVLTLHTVLVNVFKSARKQRLIVVNPMEEVDAPPSPKADPKALDEKQLAILLRGAEGHWLEDVILTALSTGMRRGELSGLKWQHVNLDARQIRIDAQLVQYEDQSCEDTAPKTENAKRPVDLSNEIVDVLRRRRAAAAAALLAAGQSIEDAYVFTAADGIAPIKPEAITNCFRNLRLKIGLGGTSIHKLRHTHVTQLLESVGQEGAKAVSERVGHSDVKFTISRYQKVFPKDRRRLADLTEGMVKRSRG